MPGLSGQVQIANDLRESLHGRLAGPSPLLLTIEEAGGQAGLALPHQEIGVAGRSQVLGDDQAAPASRQLKRDREVNI
jgi:hypothetical protein